MACQLQPECNFSHRFFKCKLPVEVVDVEVKVMSMQGTHLYKRNRTTQVTKCVPLTNNICPHTNIIKKMKTFWRWRIKWECPSKHPCQTVNLDPHSWKLIQIYTDLTMWKEEKQLCQKESLDQPSPRLP